MTKFIEKHFVKLMFLMVILDCLISFNPMDTTTPTPPELTQAQIRAIGYQTYVDLYLSTK